MYWKEAIRKFTDFQAKKMLILIQLRVPFSSYSISVSEHALPKILEVFSLHKFYSAAFALVELEYY